MAAIMNAPHHACTLVPHTSAATDAAQATQEQVSGEIATVHAQYAHTSRDGRPPENGPRLDFEPYRSSILRHPIQNAVHADPEAAELWAPAFGNRDVDPLEADLTIQHGGDPIGERMIVTGRILDSNGRPVRRQLVEVWQANAAGRYIHKRDQHPAPLDPHFTGTGRCLTDDEGWYRFTTIKPGPYPWKNHRNAWRPAHIHFSVFGTAFTQRLVTQMYFPGDPLFPFDPIYQAIVDEHARERLVARYDHSVTEHEWCTGYRWDLVLGGSTGTPLEDNP